MMLIHHEESALFQYRQSTRVLGIIPLLEELNTEVFALPSHLSDECLAELVSLSEIR